VGVAYSRNKLALRITRKNAIVEYLGYQKPVTQLNGDMQAAKPGPKGNGDMQAAKPLKMRHTGGRQI